MIANVLGKSKPYLNSGNIHQRVGGEKSAYPTGKRLCGNAQEAARGNAPLSKSTGKTLRFDYNSHAGCHSSDCRHVLEQMKTTWIHRAGLMQLARRGGLPVNPIIGTVKGVVIYKIYERRIQVMSMVMILILNLRTMANASIRRSHLRILTKCDV